MNSRPAEALDAPRVKRLRSESSSRSSVSSGGSVSTKVGSVHFGEETPRMEPVPSRFLWDVSQGDSVVMGVTATPKMRPLNFVSESMSPRSESKEATPSSSRKVSFSVPSLELSEPTDLVAEADEYEVVSRQGSEEWVTTKLRGVRSGKEVTLEHVGFTLVEVSSDGEKFTSKNNNLQVFASEDSMAAARLNR